MSQTVTFSACKHLSFDRKKYVASVKMNLISHSGTTKVTWNRPENEQLCQFCELRGRINDAIGCLSETEKYCNDYNDAIHIVPLTFIDTD